MQSPNLMAAEVQHANDRPPRAARPRREDRIAAARAARDWRKTLQANAFATIGEEIAVLSQVFAFAPDEPAMLRRLIQAAWKAGDEDLGLKGLRALAAAAPGDPWLAGQAARWEGAVCAGEAEVSKRTAVKFGLRLEAAGALADRAFAATLEQMDACNFPADRLLALARRYGPPAPETCALLVGAWAAKADAAIEAEQWAAALRAARVAYALRPDAPNAERVIGILLRLPDTPPDVVDLLRQALAGDPTLGGLAGRLANRVKYSLRAAYAKEAWERVVTLHQGLEALGGGDPLIREQALAALVALPARHDELPAMIARFLKAAGRLPAWMAGFIAATRKQLDEARRRQDWPECWRGAAIVASAEPGDFRAALAMVEAAPHLGLAPGLVLQAWAEVSRRQLARFSPPEPLHASVLRFLLETAMSVQESDADWRLGALTVFDIAAQYGVGLSALEALVSHAAEAGRWDSVLDMLSEERFAALSSFVQALGSLRAGQQSAARGAFSAALAGDLKKELRQCAEHELRAATFEPLNAVACPDEPALVLIEQPAFNDLLQEVRRLAATFDICAPLNVFPNADDDVGESRGESAMEIPFRRVDMPEVAEAASATAAWLYAEILKASSGRARATLRAFEECYRRELFFRLHPRFLQLYNFVKAARESDRKRIFVIAGGGQIAEAFAAHAAARWPDRELRIASGSKSPAARRRFSAESALSGPVQRRPRRAEPADADALSLGRLIGLPGPLAPEGSPTKPPCLIVIARARRDIIAPLPALAMSLSRHWSPIVVYLDPMGDADAFTSILTEHPDYPSAGLGLRVIDTMDLRASALAQADPAFGQTLEAIGLDRAPPAFGDVAVDRIVAPVLAGAEGAVAGMDALNRWFRTQLVKSPPAFALFLHSNLLEMQAICQIARRHGTRTFWLQLLQHPRDATFFRPLADRHLVIDRYSKALWRDHINVPEDEITVVGSLRLEHTQKRVAGVRREAVLEELGLPPATRFVLVATQPIALGENLKLIEIVARALRALADVWIVVKLHPAEPEERVAPIARALTESGFAGRFLATKSQDLYKLIIGSELVVVKYSNVGIEAALLDRPVVSITVGSEITTFSLADHGVTTEISDEKAAIAQVRKLMTRTPTGKDSAARRSVDRMRRAYLAENPELHDGHVTDRIIAAIEADLRTAKERSNGG